MIYNLTTCYYADIFVYGCALLLQCAFNSLIVVHIHTVNNYKLGNWGLSCGPSYCLQDKADSQGGFVNCYVVNSKLHILIFLSHHKYNLRKGDFKCTTHVYVSCCNNFEQCNMHMTHWVGGQFGTGTNLAPESIWHQEC